MANSYEPSESGAYTLELKASPTEPSRAILQEEGALVAGGPVLPSDNSLYREYTFEGRAGQSVAISLESTDFAIWLSLALTTDYWHKMTMGAIRLKMRF